MTAADTDATRRDAAATALRRLLDGNRRFVAGTSEHRDATADERAALVDGQSPIATVIACVDSRVPPEVVLDQGLGDLLTIRTAGQAIAGAALGSIEFGVAALAIPLVVVLGHTGCGAVKAAVAGSPVTGPLGELVGEVAGRLAEVEGRNDPTVASDANIAATVAALRSAALVDPEGRPPHVVGLRYDLASGAVTVLDDDGLPVG